MLNDLNTSVSTISSEALDKLFEDSAASVTADDLLVGKAQGNVKVTPEDKTPVHRVATDSIPTIDLDAIKDDEEEVPEATKEEPEVPEVKEVPEEKKEKPEGEKEEKEEKKEEPAEKTPEEIEAVTELLKNSVGYLVEKGIFKDFEGREDLEVNEEVFADLLEKQVEAIAEERYNEKKQSAGEYGQAILDYLEEGGNPDEIIDLFKERKEIQQLDITDDDSKVALITKWYTEVYGWKPERIKRELTTLEAEEGGLDTEAEEIKSKYDARYQEQLTQMKEAQTQVKQQQIKAQKEFESNISKAIDNNPDFDDKRRRMIKDSILKFKTLEDGTRVNELFLKFQEVQKDPNLYVEFAEYILDKQGFIERKKIEINNKIADKTFNFVKGNTALTKNKGSKFEDRGEKASSSGTNFSVIFKK